MASEGGAWIMQGMAWDDPYKIRTWRELVRWINEIGFLPLFANGVAGFSAEEHVSPNFWWTGDREQDGSFGSSLRNQRRMWVSSRSITYTP